MSKAWQYKHVREYLALLRRADQALAKGCRIRLRWNGDAMDVEEWRDERIKALDKRITLKGGKSVGRKHSEQYQIGLFPTVIAFGCIEENSGLSVRDT